MNHNLRTEMEDYALRWGAVSEHEAATLILSSALDAGLELVGRGEQLRAQIGLLRSAIIQAILAERWGLVGASGEYATPEVLT